MRERGIGREGGRAGGRIDQYLPSFASQTHTHHFAGERCQLPLVVPAPEHGIVRRDSLAIELVPPEHPLPPPPRLDPGDDVT